MKNQVLDRVLKSPRLPSLPAIALRVIELVQQDVSIKQIAEAIQHDPALSSKILKTVNSSFYGQVTQISTISHALVVMGLNAVKTLALGFSLVGNLKDSGGEGFDHMAFWKRCLFSAAGSRVVAANIQGIEQEQAFLGGLLQDLGMLAMSQVLGEQYMQVLREAGSNHKKLVLLEREAFETDHAELGAALAESWRLPKLLIAPIKYHERIDDAPPADLSIVRCVVLGDMAAEVFEQQEPGEALERYYRRVSRELDMPEAVAEEMLRETHKQTRDMRRLFDLETGGLGDADEILARANETLTQISLQNQMHSSELEQQNRRLTDQANTDSLTGVANRRRLNEYVAEHFEKARAQKQPLSVLFLDTDHFKKFNDTYGHQTGDRVLVKKAQTLDNLLGQYGLVARYGGEEFAVVLPGVDRRQASQLAEQARQMIARASVESDDGEPLHITASIGVSTYEGAFFTSAEQLIKAADQGVYAAKDAGRNTVRIFIPRVNKGAA